MSIRKRTWGDGKEGWQVDLLVRGKRVRKQFSNKGDAKAFELEVRTQARAGTYLADSTKVTLREIYPKYLEHIEGRHTRGKSMTRMYKVHLIANIQNYVMGGVPIRRHGKSTVFDHGIADYKLFDLTPEVIEQFYDRILDMGRTTKTVRGVANTLQSILEFARVKRYIVINPALKVQISAGRNSKSSKKVTPPTKELVAAYLKVAGETDRLNIAFAALTGARAGEHRALRWKKVDVVSGLVVINTRVDRWGDEDGQGAKSDSGNREIPISLELAHSLSEWRSRTKFSSDEDLVFPGRNGRPRNHESHTRTHFAKLYEKIVSQLPTGAPRPARPRWHDLRHFAISTWIEAGLPLKAVQEFAGHSDPALTLRVYGHLFPSEGHRAKMDLIADEVLETKRAGAFEMARRLLKTVNPDILDVRFSADARVANGKGVHVTIETNLDLFNPGTRERAMNVTECVLSQLTSEPLPSSITLRAFR